MNYGFVIDNRRCIGCHACSTACKSENEVPLGVHRTWVKSVEHGAYPNVRRSFQVTRCNHCENPPCVRICPVTAMYQRADGIVEFDPDRCIGCKACIQACPYDAIHIDPATNTAAKCHFCSHRVDIGLEPACAVVCPTHAIIAGDLDDPDSEAARILAANKVTVRKPEQGTRPKVFYIEGEAVAMHPTVFAERPRGLAFADIVTEQGIEARPSHASPSTRSVGGTPIRSPALQVLPAQGPIRTAEQMAQVTYRVDHRMPWHWPVPAYLVTKAIASGVFMLLAFGRLFHLFEHDVDAMVFGGLLALVALAATAALLVVDLERPERFWMILARPQWRSWLTRGAVILVGFSLVSTLWWGFELLGAFGMANSFVAASRPFFAFLTLPLAIGAAIYTAFLFAQAEGRDFWQSPLLPVHLLVQSAAMGAGAILLLSAFVPLGEDLVHVAFVGFAAMLAFDLFVVLLGELAVPHATEVAALAAHEIQWGAFRHYFWIGAILVGHLVPLSLLVLDSPLVHVIAVVMAVVGLWCWEHAFVMAPQRIPNS